MKTRALPMITLACTLVLGGPAVAENLAQVDQAFLEQAAQNGHAEVSAGRLALTKARNPKVRDFAQRMVDEHTQLGEDLKLLAAARRYTPPSEPSRLQKGKEMIIAGLGDATFDRRYLNQMGVEAPKATIPLYEKTARESRDPEVKAFASKHLPALRQHLQTAQELKVSVDQEPSR